MREHDPEGRDVERFRRHLYGSGKQNPVSKGSIGAELIEGFEIKEGEYKLVKTRFSAFFDTNLHSLLQATGITDLVICGKIQYVHISCYRSNKNSKNGINGWWLIHILGVQTPNCIRQTVFDAISLDYHSITVLYDATAAASVQIHHGMWIFWSKSLLFPRTIHVYDFAIEISLYIWQWKCCEEMKKKYSADELCEMKSNEWWGNFWIFFVPDNITDMENVGVVVVRVDQWDGSVVEPLPPLPTTGNVVSAGKWSPAINNGSISTCARLDVSK